MSNSKIISRSRSSSTLLVKPIDSFNPLYGSTSTDTYDDEIERDAQKATAREHSMSIKEALHLHKRAVVWSILISATIIMEGYDQSLIASFYGYPSFQRKYGIPTGDGNYELESRWMSALGCAANIGMFIGVMANGYLAEKWGHRKVIMGALILVMGFVFFTVFAPTIYVLLLGEWFFGLVMGCLSTMGPTYSSEVCPMVLRGYLTAYINMCWAIGQLIAAGVLKSMVENKTDWGYRVPFAVQWVWPIPLFICVYLAPDSPWWLVRKGREADALVAVKRLSADSVHQEACQVVAMIIHTNRLELSRTKHSTSNGIWESVKKCFTVTNVRRTEITCLTFAMQVTCGSQFMYSPSYFWRQAGLSAEYAYQLNVCITGIALVGCGCSWMLMTKFGRRPIYITGSSILLVCLFMEGVLQLAADRNPDVKWVQCGFTMVWVAVYSLSVGPLAYTIAAEIPATRVKSQTLSVARAFYHSLQLMAGIMQPFLINPRSANLKGYTGFVWSFISLPAIVWAFFRLPETKNRTYEELDIMFNMGLPSRQFSEYKFDGNDYS
ncbi:sugar transporter [Yamadazyma tenuis ATCC 10573]|uniref:Sugar transporter n=1 Tax=Candida tenuis (strain ATCC 10573 / BCRC 21748 / CBS 615 / JCM 9827 / NBRC 10315 / NRRL Y-1498 / VKM Y-70) TaxID=590646 RepID=G3BEA7_CANTC|nr:uncharacterized protein CANTEDRAFT_109956 [Yamadazyma tenuis ATCC 10573]XP_006690552.1 sugar transporter [Yamadazyma tenuis ATCC 10573]EGV61337.1 hypothetical protein CANTEDRAFT_109956 [Yamadazyma tenuis ATCC 10573]EGV61338.1 sugar transporter [Yamadazyma tenuis ATCC 10573]